MFQVECIQIVPELRPSSNQSIGGLAPVIGDERLQYNYNKKESLEGRRRQNGDE